MTWQLILFDWIVIGTVVFIVGALAHKLEVIGFRPTYGWIVCYLTIVVCWPLSVFGLLRAVFRFILMFRR